MAYETAKAQVSSLTNIPIPMIDEVELEPQSREIATFVTHENLFRYKMLMFSVSCAPEMYQPVMQQTLQRCRGVQNILDDMIVYGRCKEEHDKRLNTVLARLQESKLTRGLNLYRRKCCQLEELDQHQGKGCDWCETNKE